jgi:hypothetical protein
MSGTENLAIVDIVAIVKCSSIKKGATLSGTLFRYTLTTNELFRIVALRDGQVEMVLHGQRCVGQGPRIDPA